MKKGPIKKGDLRAEIDFQIEDAQKKIKRSRSHRVEAFQEGRIAALEGIRAVFLGGPEPPRPLSRKR